MLTLNHNENPSSTVSLSSLTKIKKKKKVLRSAMKQLRTSPEKRGVSKHHIHDHKTDHTQNTLTKVYCVSIY